MRSSGPLNSASEQQQLDCWPINDDGKIRELVDSNSELRRALAGERLHVLGLVTVSTTDADFSPELVVRIAPLCGIVAKAVGLIPTVRFD